MRGSELLSLVEDVFPARLMGQSVNINGYVVSLDGLTIEYIDSSEVDCQFSVSDSDDIKAYGETLELAYAGYVIERHKYNVLNGEP
jgi:hypothetical protein